MAAALGAEQRGDLCQRSPIILSGADWFASLGTEKSKGTKVFALSGALNNIGLVEVPMGIPLRTVIFDIGGGIKATASTRPYRWGNPSAAVSPSPSLDTPVDYENINKTGAIMGSGGMVVMDETTCMPAMAKFFLGFTEDESCKCVPCRVGNKTLLTILARITRARAAKETWKLLLDLSQQIKDTSLCGLGQTSPNPVLTTIKYFREEYEAHIKENGVPPGSARLSSSLW